MTLPGVQLALVPCDHNGLQEMNLNARMEADITGLMHSYLVPSELGAININNQMSRLKIPAVTKHSFCINNIINDIEYNGTNDIKQI